ncbi:MAG: hypothetical protein M3440_04925 [Chloroflexota bacterium]|nr:hypothetical protein [Chloroflexota bacterium]
MPLDRETLARIAWDASEADLAASPGFEAYDPQPWEDCADRPVGGTAYGAMAVAVANAVLDSLIAEASIVHEGMLGPWPEGCGALVADWLREQKEEVTA